MHRVVPELIIQNYRAGRFRGEFQAAGLFLDLSGFSTMTDALMQHGQHGAEVLASLMHGVFDPLVESIFEYGGKIVGFAGDGIMALYPVDEDAKLTALRALASAQVIQKRFADYPTRQTVYGKFPNTARIGLAYGSVDWGILRSYSGDQATYYFRGSAVDDSATAEHHARPADILLTQTFCNLLQAEIESIQVGLYERFAGFRAAAPGRIPLHFPPIDVKISRLFMPAEVISHDVRGEFRQIVNLFMRFPDLNDTQMSILTSEVFELRNQYGGLLTRLDFGDKGCNMLMLWGAPVAYENDIGRALNFLIDLKARVDFPITAGVTYYIAHAGYLGSSMCEDYTCYGWGVNLASRFMMSAPIGDIWVDDRIARRMARRFDMEFVGSQQFKGFSAEQSVHSLRGYKKLQEPLYAGELVGRDAEFAQLKKFIEPLRENKFAGLLLISGDAGIGKGRLVYEFRASETFAPQDVLWVVCQSDQILRQSFNPLRGWLWKYFDLSPSEPFEGQRQKFDAQLDRLIVSIPDPELARELQRTRSVLGALVNLSWEDSLYEQLDAEGRYNNTFLALIALLKAESLCHPVVFFLEDLQFTDGDSREFLPRLKRSVLAAKEPYPIAIVVTTRPNAINLDEETVDARIDLPGLSRESMAQLANNWLGGPASPDLVTLLWTRSEGNPYFAEQILHYLQEDSFLETSVTGWALIRRLRHNFIPTDIRAILVARLDQLTHEVKEIIQTASVLGREFELNVLMHMLLDQADVPRHVLEAEKAAIWMPLNEIRYIFTHGLLRDAAYEMQMRARRQELHALAVAALENLYHGEASKHHHAELAYHSEYAGLNEKAIAYFMLAGNAASGLYQNWQAVEYYSRALTLVSPDQLDVQFDLLVDRVDLFNRLGNRDLQLKDLRTMESLANRLDDHIRRSRTLMLYANYYYLTGKYPETIEHAQQAFSFPGSSEMEPELVFLARITWFLANLRLGEVEQAMKLGQETLLLARGSADRRQLSRVLTAVGLVAFEQKEPAGAGGYFVEALEIANELQDRNLAIRAMNNLAMFESAVHGDYERALSYYERTLEMTRQIGDRTAETYSLATLGFAAGLLGDFLKAEEYLKHALLIARESDHSYSEIYVLINLSSNAALQNRATDSLVYARASIELSQKVGEQSGEAWGWLYMGHAQILLEELNQARLSFNKSLEIRERLDQPSLSMEPIAGLVETDMRAGDLETATREVEKILAHLEQGGNLNGADEPLRVYYSCYQLLQKKQDPRAGRVLQAAFQMLEEQLSKFKNERLRQAYIENVPWRYALQLATTQFTQS
ncbi:MAG TPA: tetratricopeptide repeat protein [Anaerolineales bacterium]|nr:tetratricopeptide repeat protein [Anaerolineales bacterium]